MSKYSIKTYESKIILQIYPFCSIKWTKKKEKEKNFFVFAHLLSYR